MKKEMTFKIADNYFTYGLPTIDIEKGTITHIEDPEIVFERDGGNETTTHLTSAWFWGFENIDKYDAQESKVVSYNYALRTVTIEVVFKATSEYQIKTYINNEKHHSHLMTKAEMLKWKKVNEKNNVCATYLKVVGDDAVEVI